MRMRTPNAGPTPAGPTPAGSPTAALSLTLLCILLLTAPPPAAAQDCLDLDGDGYGAPGDPSCSASGATDCDDGDPAIHPGATELCNDVDDNCADGIDEGFDLGEICALGNPDPDNGPCYTAGTLVCSADRRSSVCELSGPPDLFSEEGPAGSPSCFDLDDNDCDGLTDHQEPGCQTAELCNGFDDDGDGAVDEAFPNLGLACVVGVGSCRVDGEFVCSGDQSDSVCSAVPGVSTDEGPPGSGRCADFADNDCDGLTDLADPSCQEPERCDGRDNDGNGLIDETFTDLGQACSDGVGVCRTNGTRVCDGSGSATACNTSPGAAATEGPSGITCSDGLDNDCDGLSDRDDPGCGSAGLAAACSLPYLRGGQGADCTGWHRIDFNVSGAAADAVVTAELLALDLEGNVLGALPVEWGDEAHLASRVHADDFKLSSKSNHKGTRHQIFAPIPVLRVRVEDGLGSTQAFCSNIPYLQVIEPANTVVSGSQGDVTRLLAAAPLLDPETLSIRVDGVDLLSELRIDPAFDLPGGPFSGTVAIDGRSVLVSDLVVDLSSDIALESSNSVRATLSGLGGGGHLFRVEGDPPPSAFPDPVSAACHTDDQLDTAVAMGFAITLDSPGPGEVTTAVPTPVLGRVEHGRPIAGLSINGLGVDTSGQLFTPGDGESSADSYRLDFSVALPQTDLATEIVTGNAPLGTFDLGANRLIADAEDNAGNRTFAGHFFTVAPLPSSFSAPGPTLASAGSMAVTHAAATSSDLDNALVFGMTSGAGQTLFTSQCEAQGEDLVTEFTDQVTTIVAGLEPMTEKIELPVLCDPDVAFGISSASFDSGFDFPANCRISFGEGTLTASAGVPNTTFFFGGDGYCKDTEEICIPVIGCFDVCISEVILDFEANAVFRDMGLAFEISEQQLEEGGSIQSTFIPDPGPVNPRVTDDNLDVNCLLGPVFDFLSFINILYQLFTFNFDGGFLPGIEQTIEAMDLSDFFQAPENGPAFPIEQLEFSTDVDQFMVSFASILDDVEIRADPDGGLTGAFRGGFSPQMIDPTVPSVAAPELTPAPAPSAPLAGADDTFIALSDDSFNQMFASITQAGKLQSSCQPVATVGDFLPPDCDADFNPNPQLNASQQGYCHGLRGSDCETLAAGSGSNTAVKQGVCHGAQGDDCATLANPDFLLAIVERTACSQTPNFNLTSDTPLLVCPVQDLPPRLLIQDDPATPEVETVTRLNDLSVTLIADRDEDTAAGGELSSLPDCGANDDTPTGDCVFSEICLDLDVFSSLAVEAGPDGALTILPTVDQILQVNRPDGVVCGGPFRALLNPASQIAVSQNIQNFLDTLEGSMPRLETEGLSLGGLVTIDRPRMIAIETDGDTDFGDYLAITGQAAPVP